MATIVTRPATGHLAHSGRPPAHPPPHDRSCVRNLEIGSQSSGAPDRLGGSSGGRLPRPAPPGDGVRRQLLISFDHFFIFLSIPTTFAPELSESCGQNR
jgi:hypothetical protein